MEPGEEAFQVGSSNELSHREMKQQEEDRHLSLALTRWGLLVTWTRAAVHSGGIETLLELAEEPVGCEEVETGGS